jgi:hypothetical protein
MSGTRNVFSVLVLVAAAARPDVAAGGPGALQGIVDAQSVAPKQPAAFPRLDTASASVAASPAPLEAAGRAGFVVRDGRVQVIVECRDEGAAAALVRQLETEGSRNVSHAFELVQADVTAELLRRLGAYPDVVSVRRPSYVPRPAGRPLAVAAQAVAGSFMTEGAAAMNAPAWHAAGYTGQGVRVGVIDGEFAGWDTLRGSELPDASKVTFQSFGGTPVGDGGHGTACAEVIHDLAPSAELFLAVVSTEVDIANAVSWMQSNGVKVISMSLGWLSWGPGDGTGYLASVIDSFVSGGGVWVNSAGNSRLAHWQGVWRDDNGNGFLNFDASWEVNPVTFDGNNFAAIPAGTKISASMIWNQWSSPPTDLDFFIYKNTASGWVKVAESIDEQSGQAGQKPIEEIVYTADEEAAYGFVIQGVSGPANVDIEFFNRLDGSPLGFNVQDGSITPPADTASAIAAAALDAAPPYALESYSSRGPTNGPGGALSGGSVKPDLSGYAVVSTASYGARGGGNGFNGTSAACPHIAGAAALVRSAYPAYTPAQVRSFLEGRAADMGPAGKDIDYGFGRLSLGDPPAAACDAPAPPGGVNVAPNAVSSGTPFTISWNAATNATSYEVQEATNNAFTGATTLQVAGTSTQRTKTVASTTTFYYRVRAIRTCTGATAQSGFSSAVSVTVAAGGGGTTASLWVPVITRASGANSSQWRSDVGLLNLQGSSASCDLVFKSGATTKAYSTTIAPNVHTILRDVVGPSYLNGSGSGSLEVRCAPAVLVTSRTYNQNANGTFGQNYDAYASSFGLAAGQNGTLPHLSENAAYRSNIGLVNTGAATATATVTLYDGANGALVGSYTVTLAPGEWKQESQPYLKKFGRNNLEAGYARVNVTAGSGVIALASVVDNNASSNDPTTIVMQR